MNQNESNLDAESLQTAVAAALDDIDADIEIRDHEDGIEIRDHEDGIELVSDEPLREYSPADGYRDATIPDYSHTDAGHALIDALDHDAKVTWEWVADGRTADGKSTSRIIVTDIWGSDTDDETDTETEETAGDTDDVGPDVPPVADALAELEEKVLATDGGQPTDDRDLAETAHSLADRGSGVEAARELAESLREERTEVVSWRYERVGPSNTERIPEEVDFPNHEQLARDVAEQTIDATWYAEEETVPAGKTPALGTVYDDETRYVVAIASGDRELVIYPGGLTETRDATPVPDRAGATDDDDQFTLAEPPSYADD